MNQPFNRQRILRKMPRMRRSVVLGRGKPAQHADGGRGGWPWCIPGGSVLGCVHGFFHDASEQVKPGGGAHWRLLGFLRVNWQLGFHRRENAREDNS